MVAVAAVLIAVAALVGVRFHTFRPREVVTGQVYRSKQPNAQQLERTFSEQKVRTVINLRGRNDQRPWYQEEADACSRAGVALVNLPLETFDWPPRIETQRFVRAYDAAARPLLLHCATGVDRTGWAAAVVRLLEGDPLPQALEEMSAANGHLCRRERCPLHQFFVMYEGWLQRQQLRHTAANFRTWALDIYTPVPYDADVRLATPIPTAVTPGATVATRVYVVNRSPKSWMAQVDPSKGVRLGARVLGPFPSFPPDAVDRIRAPRVKAADLFRDFDTLGPWPPGVARQIAVSFKAPSEPGTYILQFDMVDEMVHWFSDLGREGVIVPLTVK